MGLGLGLPAGGGRVQSRSRGTSDKMEFSGGVKQEEKYLDLEAEAVV